MLHSADNYWQDTRPSHSSDVRLLVKRVFITNDLGDEPLPKWASWVKVVVDGIIFNSQRKFSYTYRLECSGRSTFECLQRNTAVYKIFASNQTNYFEASHTALQSSVRRRRRKIRKLAESFWLSHQTRRHRRYLK